MRATGKADTREKVLCARQTAPNGGKAKPSRRGYLDGLESGVCVEGRRELSWRGVDLAEAGAEPYSDGAGSTGQLKARRPKSGLALSLRRSARRIFSAFSSSSTKVRTA